MASIRDMEVAAEKAAVAHGITSRAYHTGFPYASPEAEAAALANFVPAHVCFGRVMCLASKVSRSTDRRGHWRFTWTIDGKRATVEQVAALCVPCAA